MIAIATPAFAPELMPSSVLPALFEGAGIVLPAVLLGAAVAVAAVDWMEVMAPILVAAVDEGAGVDNWSNVESSSGSGAFTTKSEGT